MKPSFNTLFLFPQFNNKFKWQKVNNVIDKCPPIKILLSVQSTILLYYTSVFKAFKYPWKEQKYNCEAKRIFGLELERGKFWTVWEYSQYFMFLTSAWKFQKIWIWHNCLITCLHSIILSYSNMTRHEHTLSYLLYLYYSNIKYLYAVIMDVTQNTKKSTTYMGVE